MAKRKNEDSNNDLTFNGQSIDPEIQKKVDDYMNLDEPVDNMPDNAPSGGKKVPVMESVAAEEGPATAPLLPTEELPDSVKEPVKKSAKIKVVHADEAESDEKSQVASKNNKELDTDQDESDDEALQANQATEEIPKEPSADEAIPEETAEELDSTPETEESIPNQDTDSNEAEETPDAEPTEALETPVEPVPPEPEPVSAVDADNLAAPDFDEKVNYKGKTVADMESLPLDDPETAQAVEDIIAADADQILDIEDQKNEAKPVVAASQPKPKKAKKRGNFFKIWFTTPLYRNLTIVVVLAGLIIAAFMPSSRYFLLNTAGVKVSTSIRVLDSNTSLPLKNVELLAAGKSAKSDADGNVKLAGIPLGHQTLTIKKPAFAEVTKEVTLGWGSNPLGDVKLQPVGNQYTFVLTDFLSDKPVTNGEVSYGEASAKFSDKGEAVLTVPNIKEETIDVSVSAKDYRTETVKASTVEKQDKYQLKLVPAKPHIYFSKKSGKVDLYKSDVDGKNQTTLLNGTGLERDDSLAIAVHPNKNIAAFSSSRENVRNKDGYLLNTLQLIDLDTKEVIRVAQSERIQIIDWVGDRLVYVRMTEGASEANPDRHRLVSYDLGTRKETELATTNYFNDVLSANGAVYYSPALYQVNGSVGLYKINADGTNKKTIFQKEVWNLFRTSFDKVSLSVGQDWYELNLTTDALTKVGGAPSVLKSRVYVASPDAKQNLWIDERDGKSVLVSYQQDTKEDKVLLSESGIKNPIRWLDGDHVVFRIANGQETADYIINIHGGEPKKIADVTNSLGIDRWYYF